MERITVLLGLFAMVGDPINYARTHREHHAFADTHRDPHSPMHGKWHAFIGWMLKDRKKFGPAIIRDLLTPEYRWLQNIAKRQVTIVWCTWMLFVLLSPSVAQGLTMAMLVSFALEMLVNVVAHIDGQAVDKKWIAWISMASYHGQHHQNPGVLHAGDPGKLIVKLLEKRT